MVVLDDNGLDSEANRPLKNASDVSLELFEYED